MTVTNGSRWAKGEAPKAPRGGVRIRLGAITNALLMELLWRRNCSYEDMHKATGLSHSAIKDYVARLIDKGLVRVIGRRPNDKGHMTVLLFRFDPDNTHKDEEWRISGAARSRKYRALRKLKKEGAVSATAIRNLVEQVSAFERNNIRSNGK